MLPSEAIDAALDAGEAARADLRRRGIDPRSRQRLLAALESATAGMLAASAFRAERVKVPRELADVPRWREYVAECRRRLMGDGSLDWPPQPPTRSSARLQRELRAAEAQRASSVP